MHWTRKSKVKERTRPLVLASQKLETNTKTSQKNQTSKSDGKS